MCKKIQNFPLKTASRFSTFPQSAVTSAHVPELNRPIAPRTITCLPPPPPTTPSHPATAQLQVSSFCDFLFVSVLPNFGEFLQLLFFFVFLLNFYDDISHCRIFVDMTKPLVLCSDHLASFPVLVEVRIRARLHEFLL